MMRLLLEIVGGTALLASAACGGTPPGPGDPPAHACAAAEAGLPDANGGPMPDSSAPAEASPFDASPDVVAEAPGPPPEASSDAPAEAFSEGAAPDGQLICDDNLKDGDETDIDCGGSHCPPCALGQTCLINSDCGSWLGCDAAKGGCACDGVTGTCVTDHCSDHKKDVGESDVDCGGGECSGCAVGKACVLGSDCASDGCDLLSKTCATSTCADHVQDGNETGVDCGGGECPGCALGINCQEDWDCAAGACDDVSFVCIADACFDHHQDGKETDVDCGGPACAARCPVGKKCITTSDCATGATCPTGSPHVCD